MSKWLFTIFGILLLTSCVRNTNDGAISKQDSIQRQAKLDSIASKRYVDSLTKQRALFANKLQPFNTLPDTVTRGCYGIFSKDRKQFSQKEYIIATNRLDAAVINVNDTLLFLSLKEKVRPTEKSYKATYGNDDCILYINAKYLKKINDDKWIYKGKATLFYKKKKSTYNLYGHIGC